MKIISKTINIELTEEEKESLDVIMELLDDLTDQIEDESNSELFDRCWDAFKVLQDIKDNQLENICFV